MDARSVRRTGTEGLDRDWGMTENTVPRSVRAGRNARVRSVSGEPGPFGGDGVGFRSQLPAVAKTDRHRCSLLGTRHRRSASLGREHRLVHGHDRRGRLWLVAVCRPQRRLDAGRQYRRRRSRADVPTLTQMVMSELLDVLLLTERPTASIGL